MSYWNYFGMFELQWLQGSTYSSHALNLKLHLKHINFCGSTYWGIMWNPVYEDPLVSKIIWLLWYKLWSHSLSKYKTIHNVF